MQHEVFKEIHHMIIIITHFGRQGLSLTVSATLRAEGNLMSFCDDVTLLLSFKDLLIFLVL
jgi:hypothetical protein